MNEVRRQLLWLLAVGRAHAASQPPQLPARAPLPLPRTGCCPLSQGCGLHAHCMRAWRSQATVPRSCSWLKALGVLLITDATACPSACNCAGERAREQEGGGGPAICLTD